MSALCSKECFEILSNTIEQAQFYENNEILTIAQKQELEYLLRLNFPNMTEQELFINILSRMNL